MKGKLTPVIFSGHNDRAVVALCRYFTSIDQMFILVARDAQDIVYQTSWVGNVIIQRDNSTLNIHLMSKIAHDVNLRGLIPSLCPTSEFLNNFALNNREEMKSQGWHFVFPSIDVYASLSNKSRSPLVIESLIDLQAPSSFREDDWQAPCVFKPNVNVSEGRVLYPRFCKTSDELISFKNSTDFNYWFCQEWIDGQSLYFCCYLDKWGDWSGFWQENLLQQPDGKSMVLARTCENPGVDTSKLMSGLYEMGYRGPFMMEVIQDAEKKLFFIEINPRFWGPLDLARRACSELLHRYISDMNGVRMAMKSHDNVLCLYAWAYGARLTPLKIYPAAKYYSFKQIQSLLESNDVYSLPDTRALSLKH